uniref:Uncharacterized protein n=1 Tax=Oryza meridionalis TaxID=40149 RepID=A0A0E0DAV6_9ORYZ
MAGLVLRASTLIVAAFQLVCALFWLISEALMCQLMALREVMGPTSALGPQAAVS